MQNTPLPSNRRETDLVPNRALAAFAISPFYESIGEIANGAVLPPATAQPRHRAQFSSSPRLLRNETAQQRRISQ